MKNPHWFTRNRLLSHLRIATAVTLMAAAVVSAILALPSRATGSSTAAAEPQVISDADIRGNLGLLFAHEGKTTEAVEQLNEALRLNPNSAEAHTTLGVVLLRSGKAEESIPHFSIAIRLRPDWAVARENLKRAEEQIHMRR